MMLHEFHQSLGAVFTEVGGCPAVAHYGNPLAEHAALRQSAAVLDLSCRARLCLVGADRARYLHGQVTNDVKKLRPGQGCYAALTTLKGKMESDLNIYRLAEELLLDFEPGLTAKVTARLEKNLVADDVQIDDAAPHYGLLSVQGPQAAAVISALALFPALPANPGDILTASDATLGDLYLANQPRLRTTGFDLFGPNPALGAVADKLIAAAKALGGRAAGWTALETARIEAAIPRYGADLDETVIPLEAGLESHAIVFNKGCYIGQEVINRIHSFGRVTRELRQLRLADNLPALPRPGDKLFHDGKEVGHLTSVVHSPALQANLALAYVRREANAPGTTLTLRTPAGDTLALILPPAP